MELDIATTLVESLKAHEVIHCPAETWCPSSSLFLDIFVLSLYLMHLTGGNNTFLNLSLCLVKAHYTVIFPILPDIEHNLLRVKTHPVSLLPSKMISTHCFSRISHKWKHDMSDFFSIKLCKTHISNCFV